MSVWKKRQMLVRKFDRRAEENVKFDDGQPVDIAAGFYGIWTKRGLTSLTGVVFVMSVETGEVLDHHVCLEPAKRVRYSGQNAKGAMNLSIESRT